MQLITTPQCFKLTLSFVIRKEINTAHIGRNTKAAKPQPGVYFSLVLQGIRKKSLMKLLSIGCVLQLGRVKVYNPKLEYQK